MSTTHEGGSRVPVGELRKALPLLGGLLALLAAWFGWHGVEQWQGDQLQAHVEAARDSVVKRTTADLGAQASRLAQRLASAPVKAALAAGDVSTAATALDGNWPGLEEARVLSGDLTDGYADAKTFGYGRLALLERALLDGKPLARVYRDRDGNRLGIAAPVTIGSGDAAQPGVVFVRLPLQRLTAGFETTDVPADGYLALRQGTYSLLQKGDVGLAGGAEGLGSPLGKSGLRVAAAVPDVAPGPLGLGALPCLVAAVVLLLLAIGAIVVAKGGALMGRLARAAEGQDAEPTLDQSLQREPLARATTRTSAVDAAAADAASAARLVDPSIFRAYDIRGIVGQTLSPKVAGLIGQAVGTVMREQGLPDVVVGRDGRLSGPELSDSLIDGLRRAGINVIDIGLAPTPLVYFGTFFLRTGSGVAVTGSHNPPEYNGFKVVIGSETLSGAAITDLCDRINEGRLHTASELGGLQQRDIGDDYIQKVADDVQLHGPLKIVADAGNGVAGDLAPRLLEAIGAEVIPLYCDVDGTFPNHHPDPSDPDNLVDLVETVKRFGADLGIAFDGDGDRLGVVTRDGKVIYADRLLMLFAADVLERNPGALVIYDVKSTGRLSDVIRRHGGSPMMWKTGHSLIKSKMRESGAELAGEMSGHFFFKERWYGFDDGLYAAARLLEILSAQVESGQAATASEILDALPEAVSTPEIKVDTGGTDAHALVRRFVESAQFEGAQLSTIDGLRADWSDGWGLVRASNTTPVLVLRFEGETTAALERIQASFREQLKAIAPELSF